MSAEPKPHVYTDHEIPAEVFAAADALLPDPASAAAFLARLVSPPLSR